MLPTLVLLKSWQIMESHVTDITGVNLLPLVLCAFVLHQLLLGVKPQVAVLVGKGVLFANAAPVHHNHELPRKPILGTCWLRCQQTSVALHVLIEAEPKNPAYGRHQLSRPMRIVGPIQFFSFFRGGVLHFSKHRPSGPMLSITRNVHMFVCLFVCLSAHF